jgi:hypothetical protein
MEPVIVGLIIGVNVAVLGGGLAWRYFFSERAKSRRALKRAPLTAMSKVMDGALVRVTGTARPSEDGLLHAPLSARPCLAHEVEVEEYKQKGKHGSWKTIILERDFVSSFWLQEGRDRALVQLIYPQLVLDRDASFRSGVLKEPDENLVAYLSSHGEAPQGIIFNRNLRYREGVIEPGEVVTVLAVGKSEPDPDPAATPSGYRGRAMRLVLRSPAEGEMLISDERGLTRRS